MRGVKEEENERGGGIDGVEEGSRNRREERDGETTTRLFITYTKIETFREMLRNIRKNPSPARAARKNLGEENNSGPTSFLLAMDEWKNEQWIRTRAGIRMVE